MNRGKIKRGATESETSSTSQFLIQSGTRRSVEHGTLHANGARLHVTSLSNRF